MLSNSDEKQCPYCGETIKAIAVLCKHCKSTLPPIKNSEKPADKIWFYRIGGIEFGPVKTEDLLGLSNRYDATRTIEIKTSENDNWQVIKSISQIKEYIEKNYSPSDDESDDVYFYRYADGPKSGPFTYNKIMQMYQNEQISSSVMISENNSDKWDVITDYIIMDELDTGKTSSTVRINNDLILGIAAIGFFFFLLFIWINYYQDKSPEVHKNTKSSSYQTPISREYESIENQNIDASANQYIGTLNKNTEIYKCNDGNDLYVDVIENLNNQVRVKNFMFDRLNGNIETYAASSTQNIISWKNCPEFACDTMYQKFELHINRANKTAILYTKTNLGGSYDIFKTNCTILNLQ